MLTRKLIGNAHYINLLMVRVTTGCTARCLMCNFWRGKRTSLSWAHLQKIIDDATGLGIKQVCFTGGEPMTYRHLWAGIKYLTKKGLVYSLITNGSCLTRKNVAKLMSSPPTRIYISIDSPDNSVHDLLRGKRGIWNSAAQGVLLLNEYDKRPKIIINYVISNKNFKEIQDLVALSQQFPFDELNLLQIKGLPRLALTKKQIRFYNKDVVPLLAAALNKHNIKLSSSNPYVFGEKPRDIAASSKGQYSMYNYKRIPCCVCERMLFIETTGEVYPCNNTPYMGGVFSLGNVFQDKLSKIVVSPRASFVRRELCGGQLCVTCDPINLATNQNAVLSDRGDIT